MPTWKRVAEPTTEPITVAELRSHLRIPAIEEEEPLLTSYIKAAREECEEYLWQQLLPATWQLTLPRFPCGLVIALPRPPFLSLDWIRYQDEANATQTLDADLYQVGSADNRPAILLNPFELWPTTYGGLADVVIQWQAGYPDPTAVPERWRIAVMLRAGDWFRNREASEPVEDLPRSIKALLGPSRAFEF